GGVGELLAYLAHENVDDLDLRLVHAAIKLAEKHFLGNRCTSAEAQEFQHLILLARQIHANLLDMYGFRIDVDHEIADLDDGLGVTPGAAHYGLDASNQFSFVEWLG